MRTGVKIKILAVLPTENDDSQINDNWEMKQLVYLFLSQRARKFIKAGK
jgi:hypothetical protein